MYTIAFSIKALNAFALSANDSFFAVSDEVVEEEAVWAKELNPNTKRKEKASKNLLCLSACFPQVIPSF